MPPGHIDLPFDKRVDQKLRQGRVAFSTQLRIVDDDGEVLPNDGVAFGPLQAKGPLVTGAYLKRHEIQVPNPLAQDVDLQEGLLARLGELTGVALPR